MGYARILWVYEDGIKGAEESQDAWDKLRPAVGQAVLSVCSREAKMAERRGAPVLNHANCVNICDEAHSSDTKVYVWSGNCLRSLRKLDAETFKAVEQAIEEEAKRRRTET